MSSALIPTRRAPNKDSSLWVNSAIAELAQLAGRAGCIASNQQRDQIHVRSSALHSWPVFTQKADLLPDGTSLSAQVAVDGGLLVGLAGSVAAEELPLSRVVLSSSGLAQFTPLRTDHRGRQHRAFRAARPGRRHSQEPDRVRQGGRWSARSACPARRRWRSCSAICRSGRMRSNSPTALLNALRRQRGRDHRPGQRQGAASSGSRPRRSRCRTTAARPTRHRLTLMTDNGTGAGA